MHETFRNRNILITGGLGFIGSNLAARLVDYGANVTLIDSLIPEYGGNLYNIREIQDQVKINISDVRDVHGMQYLIKGQDYLFNLAGQTSHMDSMHNPQADLEINCRAQLSILEICRQYNPDVKIVFASTRQIYGKPEYLPVDERHPIRPVDVNGINKMAGEWYHILYNNVYNIRSCALRLTNTFGPRMRIKDTRQTFLGIWIRKIIEGEPIEVWGGQQLRDFNYVNDVVEAMLTAAVSDQANGKIYNLGDDRTISLLNLAQKLVLINGAGEYIVREFPEDRKRIDIGDYYGDYNLIKEELGWEPRISLERGLCNALEYYRVNLSHYI
jgi:UDP-glucose 4-epimerase